MVLGPRFLNAGIPEDRSGGEMGTVICDGGGIDIGGRVNAVRAFDFNFADALFLNLGISNSGTQSSRGGGRPLASGLSVPSRWVALDFVV